MLTDLERNTNIYRRVVLGGLDVYSLLLTLAEHNFVMMHLPPLTLDHRVDVWSGSKVHNDGCSCERCFTLSVNGYAHD